MTTISEERPRAPTAEDAGLTVAMTSVVLDWIFARRRDERRLERVDDDVEIRVEPCELCDDGWVAGGMTREGQECDFRRCGYCGGTAKVEIEYRPVEMDDDLEERD